MPTLKVPARQRILHLLKRSGGLTAQEIARELEITAVAVRKHLERMQEEGLIVLHTRAASRGRPAVIYALSETGDALFPQRYDQLVVDMLQDITSLEGEEKLVRLFNLRNDRVARTYQIRLQDKPLHEAVRELARARDDDGYMANVEEGKGGFVISEHNCPIYDVAQRFPQACQCEHELFQRLLNANVTRESTLIDGATSCRYHIEGEP